MSSIDFYQNHLDRVSRSFAFCIARLDGDLRTWVSLSYLLCRILDTVEDSEWPTPASKQHAFNIFQKKMQDPSALQSISAWQKSFPALIPETEKALILDAHVVFQDFHHLPDAPRNAILKVSDP